MSTISKERLEQLASGNAWVCVQDDEAAELARIALASLEAEPVGEVSEQRDGLVMDGMVDLGGASTHRIIKGASKMKRFPLGTKFYTAPPAPVSVPDAMEMDDDFDSAFEHGKAVGWNACRAAMLQGADCNSRVMNDYPETLPCPVSLEPGLKFGKGVPTKTMLEALQRRAEYYAELEAMTPEQRAEHDAGMKKIAAMLQGAEPVTTAYKLRDAVEIIRNSGIEIDSGKIQAERDSLNSPVIPDCSCRTCRQVTFSDSRFVVCPECGNKRCPHANDHRNACTGSNEPGQEGSSYPAAPQQEVK